MGLFNKSLDERENSIVKALDTKLEIIREQNERKIEKIEKMEERIDSIQDQVDELNGNDWETIDRDKLVEIKETDRSQEEENNSFEPEIGAEEFVESSGDRRKEIIEMFLPDDIFVTKYHIIEAIFGLKEENVDPHDEIYYGVSRTLNNMRKNDEIVVSESHSGSNRNGYKLKDDSELLESEYEAMSTESQKEEVIRHTPISPAISTDRIVENMFGMKKDTNTYAYSSVYRILGVLEDDGEVVSDKARIDGKDKRVWKNDT